MVSANLYFFFLNRNFSATVYFAIEGDHMACRFFVWRWLHAGLFAAPTSCLSIASESVFVAAARSLPDFLASFYVGVASLTRFPMVVSSRDVAFSGFFPNMASS